MLLLSVACHGLLVGAAYLWPSPLTVASGPNFPVVLGTIGSDAGLQIDNLPFSTPTASDPEPSPVPPPPLDSPDDTPPPDFVPDIPDPSTPPLPDIRHPFRSVPATHTSHPAVSTARGQPGAASLTPARAGMGGNSGASRPGASGAWKTSKPPYPYAMRAARVQGSGTVRVTTDASGHVIAATVVQSTGSSALDEATCRHARSFWSGPPNSTTLVPITYRLP